MKILKVVVAATLGLLGVVAIAAFTGQGGKGAASVVDANGNLRVPAHYRTTYQFLGSWAIAAGNGHGSKGMHIVRSRYQTIISRHRCFAHEEVWREAGRLQLYVESEQY